MSCTFVCYDVGFQTAEQVNQRKEMDKVTRVINNAAIPPLHTRRIGARLEQDWSKIEDDNGVEGADFHVKVRK